MRNMPRLLLVRLRWRHSPSLELIGRCPRCEKGNRYADPFESLEGAPQQPTETQETIRREIQRLLHGRDAP